MESSERGHVNNLFDRATLTSFSEYLKCPFNIPCNSQDLHMYRPGSQRRVEFARTSMGFPSTTSVSKRDIYDSWLYDGSIEADFYRGYVSPMKGLDVRTGNNKSGTHSEGDASVKTLRTKSKSFHGREDLPSPIKKVEISSECMVKTPGYVSFPIPLADKEPEVKPLPPTETQKKGFSLFRGRSPSLATETFSATFSAKETVVSKELEAVIHNMIDKRLKELHVI